MSDTPNTSTALSEDCGGEPCSTTLKKLYEFLDGELSSEQVRTIQRHLTACPECADAKDFELALREKMRSSCTQKAPAELKNRLLQDVQDFCNQVRS